MKKIAVVGSINTDYTFKCKKLPKPSETIHGEEFKINFGGKGANEAVAIARLGAKPVLFGMVGDDLYSKENLKNLKKQKVDTSHIESLSGVSGGSAGIMLDNDTNSIIVIGGANMKVDSSYLERHKQNLLDCDIFCLQLEIPFGTVDEVINLLYENGKTVIFNPSPITKLKKSLLDKCQYVIVNEVEIKELPNYKDNEQLLKAYKGRLILTCGADGVYFYDDGVKHVPAAKIKDVKDTTGAGDTFLGAFAVAISKEMPLKDAILFANNCAGLKTTKYGAQTGMPYLSEVEEFIKKNSKN